MAPGLADAAWKLSREHALAARSGRGGAEVLALEYTPSVARHAAARVSRRAGAGGLRLREMAPPRPPGPDWVAVRPRLSGICGSDQALFTGSTSPYLGTLTSGPFVPGHEVVGEIAGGPRRGRRVVVEAALSCAVRGIEPECPECAEGMSALCRNTVGGVVSAGLQIGYCRDTGGGWSEGLVAHASQLHAVPEGLSDEDAVLVEPLACAYTPFAPPRFGGSDRRVIGAGTIGALCVAALRELAPEASVVCAAKHPAQEQLARRLGADHTCSPEAPARRGREADRLAPARRVPAAARRSAASTRCSTAWARDRRSRPAITVTRPRGRVMLVGMPGQVPVRPLARVAARARAAGRVRLPRRLPGRDRAGGPPAARPGWWPAAGTFVSTARR